MKRLILFTLVCLLQTLCTNAFGQESAIPPPAFSEPSGFYETPFDLVITAPQEGDIVIYTLDGSEPKPEHVGGHSFFYKNQYPQGPDDAFGDTLTASVYTHYYTGPFQISDRTEEADKVSQFSSTNDFIPAYIPEAPSFKGTVVLARTYREGEGLSEVAGRTYIVTPEGRSRYHLPVISLALGEDKLYDYEMGISNAGIMFDQARLNLPDVENIPNWMNNYRRSGPEWERLAHFAFFPEGADTASLNHNLGLRLHGNSSRRWPRKSFRLYPRSEYGPNRIFYPLFESLNDAEFNRIVLHNAGGDDHRANMRDAVGQLIFRPLGLHTLDAQPAILLMNGEFYGLHSIRERYDKHYFQRKNGIDESHLEMHKDGEMKEGSDAFFLATLQYAMENDLSNDDHFATFATMMDVGALRDLFISNIFAYNRDWLPNNVIMYRSTIADGMNDTRWRFALVDMDAGWANRDGLGAIEADFLDEVMYSNIIDLPGENSYGGAVADMFRAAMENVGFKYSFINRFADVMNSMLLPERCHTIIDNYKDLMAPHMDEQVARWTRPASMNVWINQVNRIKLFVEERPFFQRQHIENAFGLEGQVEVLLDVSDEAHGYIRINTIDITSTTAGLESMTYPWEGIYFKDVPIRLEAVAKPGFVFAGWEGDTNGATGPVFSQTYDGDEAYVKAVFEADGSPPDEPIHYWHFNNLTAALANVSSDQSIHDHGVISYIGTGEGFMDDVDAGTALNAPQGEPSGKALRVRNPSISRDLIVSAPTSGFEQVKVSYAAKRTTNGAYFQKIYYRTGPFGAWTFIDSIGIGLDYQLVELDLSEVAAVNDNPHFALRIGFSGPTIDAGDGNNRFDNLVVHGKALDGWQQARLPLASESYQLQAWEATSLPGTYPDYTRFYWSEDPSAPEFDIYAPGNQVYDCSYALEARPRINGLGDDGFSFISTGNPQFNFCAGDSSDTHRYVGSAVVALNTEGVAMGSARWTVRLISEGERIFVISPQYRIGSEGPFLPFDADYTFSTLGATQGDTLSYVMPLGADILEEPEVYFRFVYHQVAGTNGTRPEIALDDIELCACDLLHLPVNEEKSSLLKVYPNPAQKQLWVDASRSNTPYQVLTLFDMTGKAILERRIMPEDQLRFHIDLSPVKSGFYILQLSGPGGTEAVKIAVVP